jgi:RND family efflux transporter MFP subunit
VVARIAQPDSLMVRLGIEPQALARVLSGQLVRLAPLSAPSPSVSARITSVDRRVDPQTHLAQAISNLPRNPGLLPGAPVSARIVFAEHEDAISVPSAAVLYDRDQAYVFVVSDKVAHRRAVHLGARDGASLEIRDGLKAGELVAISGNYELQDGMAIRLAQESPR